LRLLPGDRPRLVTPFLRRAWSLAPRIRRPRLAWGTAPRLPCPRMPGRTWHPYQDPPAVAAARLSLDPPATAAT